MLKNFKWYRKLQGGVWYKHQYIKDALQLTLNPGDTFWARYANVNKFSKVIKIENYEK